MRYYSILQLTICCLVLSSCGTRSGSCVPRRIVTTSYAFQSKEPRLEDEIDVQKKDALAAHPAHVVHSV